ncbi:hypothetical protein [Novosphingobium sp.]|uniref:hypothetical protein n=1 Tax=Novosphingobium sp. TaxID=1874826 RepID=UPI00273539BB|nr:hypothetical protein [Novosphingobium sp.]MDP3908142.1 hypothetical protein [Novosphingobium sp.]
MARISTTLLIVASALTLGACANDLAEYPSLERRPAERVSGQIQPVVPSIQPGPAPAAGVLGRLDSLVAQAQAADAKFRAREGQARNLASAASGAALGSENWAVASVALSQLESARSDAMVALAELDQYYAAARIEADDARAIAAARDTVMALVAEQDRVIGELGAQLAR